MTIGLNNYLGAGFEIPQKNKGGLRKLVTKLLFQTNPQIHDQDSEDLYLSLRYWDQRLVNFSLVFLHTKIFC